MLDHNFEAAEFPLSCVFCGMEIESTEAAVDAGWIPSYYDGEDECEGPVCAACVSKRLQVGTDGELETKKGLIFPDI